MSEQIIAINNLTKAFDKTDVLKNISAEVNSGEIIALLGLNGAGKTTLLETLLGFCIPEEGVIKLFGQETNVLADQDIKKRIGFVPQQEELISSMRVDHYINMLGSFYPNWDSALVDGLCTEWDIPLTKKIRILSTGQKQKVAIVCAIAFHPELLVLDEPVASLDPKARRQFLRELIKISETNQTSIIFSTHIVSDVERVADRLWLLKEGHLVMDAVIDDIKESTVRLHVSATAEYSELTSDLELINQRQTSNQKVLTFSGWSGEIERQWKEKFEDELLIETLSLEDIFLEMTA